MKSQTVICPLCQDTVDKLVYRFHLGSERQVIERIKEINPDWLENDGACSRCIDYYHTQVVLKQRMLPEIGPYFQVKSVDDFVILPTALRVDADLRFTGKGITICFIDSGFYTHPDLTVHKSRIKKIIDIAGSGNDIAVSGSLAADAWHGTMTSVVCAGDGYLSNGLYKGIASEAELVLLKVQDERGGISSANIVKALRWVNDHHEQYDIRIVNLSVGDNEALSFKQSEIDHWAEQLIEKGIIVIAAVGNDENGSIKPPANAPNVIAVGGIDDGNTLSEIKKAYHSSYGRTIDNLMKPELIAPAIWIAAPILPGTKEQKQSVALYDLLTTKSNSHAKDLSEKIAIGELGEYVSADSDIAYIHEQVLKKIQRCKYISAHYMHVDGTSFAAPVVSAIVAQLLEANPLLTPAMIREVIFSTAKRITGLPVERQGFGIIQPRKAILKVLKREAILKPHTSPYIDSQQKQIEFYIQSDCASDISLTGDFNQWIPDVLQLEPGRNGIWKIAIPLLPPGQYRYKFLLNETTWTEDVDNPYREPDGYGGFNSILSIDQTHHYDNPQ
jgi:serine protease AprX